MEIYLEISAIITIAVIVSLLAKALRQPLIVGYIFTGIIVGPSFLNLVQSTSTIELFSKLGISILLFIVGLNLSPQVIRELGKVSLVIGIGQVAFTTIIGFIIATILGIERVAAMYVSIALTFSSTIIILKLLSDKGDLNKLYGRLAIGLLIVQDVVATLILLVASTPPTGGESMVFAATKTLVTGCILVVSLMLVSRYLLPRLSSYIASSQEFLFLFSIGWGLGTGALFYALGFSVEIGALVAGVGMSMTPYAYEASARLRPLRDFFIVLFFILLGSQLVIGNVVALIFPAIILSLFVLIGNPIIVIIIMNLIGFSRRTGFQAGMTVAQISEFSLILAALGFEFGHIDQNVLSLITLVGLITISGSAYLILYSDKIYPYFEKLLILIELKKNNSDKNAISRPYNSVLFGYQRVGDDFIDSFEKLGLEYVVVDFNPESIKHLEEKQIPHIYGDARDPEFLQEINLKSLKYMVSTIPDFETNKLLVQKIRSVNSKVIVIVISQNRDESVALYEAGATYVIMPHYLGAEYAKKIIQKYGLSKSYYHELRVKHLNYLDKRDI